MKNYTSQILFALLALVSSNASFANCENSSLYLIADYEMTTSLNGQQVRLTPLRLIRNANRIAHEYPNKQIIESWYLTSQNRIAPTRFFVSHHRAIEYSATETVHGKKETDWSYRYQLISEKLLNEMTLVAESGSGCQRQQSLKYSNGQTKIALAWLPELKLVQSFEQHNGPQSHSWTLNNLQFDKQKIQSLFEHLDSFQTTDFADIGDDHTDPFLTKMVTLGFIEKGASGFYDDNGQALEGGHTH